MTNTEPAGLTGLGKFLSCLVVLMLIGGGAFLVLNRSSSSTPQPTGTGTPTNTTGTPTSPTSTGQKPPKTAETEISEITATKMSVDKLPAPGTYTPKDNTVEVELSEYAGYAGLIVANGGMAASEESYFFKKHGFKVKFTKSEEESWPALNSGKMGASATTADVLAVYGRQFNVVVPAQIGFSRGADGMVVNKDIKKINALKGKTLVVPQFTECDFFARYLAQEAGLSVNMLQDLKETPAADKINLVFAEDGQKAGEAYLKELVSNGSRLAGCLTWEPTVSEVVQRSNGQAHILASNRNLLIIADVLVVNKGFAQANPKMVAGLVEGLLEGNKMVRENPDAHLAVIGKAFEWDKNKTQQELKKVHFSNGPENLAFFNGTIDAAGSFGMIYQSAVLAYGAGLIPDPADGDRFLDLTHLKAMETAGRFQGQNVAIAPIRNATGGALESDPLLSKDIRFFFQPNSFKLEDGKAENDKNLVAIKRMLQVSPGSRVLLRGHVDNAKIPDLIKQGGEQLVKKMALEAMQLSKNRAAEIRQLLIDKLKLDPARIETVGRGWEEPAGKDSELNRRVEVQWFTLE